MIMFADFALSLSRNCLFVFWGRFFWWWTRARESRSRKIGGAVIGQLSEMIVNTSALYWNYFTLCRRFFPAANRVAWAAWTWSGQGQEIPLRFCRPHFWNLQIMRIKMMYDMSLCFLFEFFGPYNLGCCGAVEHLVPIFQALIFLFFDLGEKRRDSTFRVCQGLLKITTSYIQRASLKQELQL